MNYWIWLRGNSEKQSYRSMRNRIDFGRGNIIFSYYFVKNQRVISATFSRFSIEMCEYSNISDGMFPLQNGESERPGNGRPQQHEYQLGWRHNQVGKSGAACFRGKNLYSSILCCLSIFIFRRSFRWTSVGINSLIGKKSRWSWQICRTWGVSISVTILSEKRLFFFRIHRLLYSE